MHGRSHPRQPQILGGWKYVTPSTGVFFDNEDDVAQAAAQCLPGPTDPRAWFQANYGPMRSSLRLSGFLHSLDGDIYPTASLRLAHEVFRHPPSKPRISASRGGITQPVWLLPPPALLIFNRRMNAGDLSVAACQALGLLRTIILSAGFGEGQHPK